MTRNTDHRSDRPAQGEATLEFLLQRSSAATVIVTWINGQPVVKTVSVEDDMAGYVVTDLTPPRGGHSG